MTITISVYAFFISLWLLLVPFCGAIFIKRRLNAASFWATTRGDGITGVALLLLIMALPMFSVPGWFSAWVLPYLLAFGFGFLVATPRGASVAGSPATGMEDTHTVADGQEEI